jgi:hypothetical protein
MMRGGPSIYIVSRSWLQVPGIVSEVFWKTLKRELHQHLDAGVESRRREVLFWSILGPERMPG